MAYRRKTLRVMSPTARKVARFIGEQESIAKRQRNLIPDLQRLDLDSRALKVAKEGLALSDSDLWGLRDAVYHALDDGYLDQNKEWGKLMVERINQYREHKESPIRWEKDNEVHAIYDSVSDTTVIE